MNPKFQGRVRSPPSNGNHCTKQDATHCSKQILNEKAYFEKVLFLFLLVVSYKIRNIFVDSTGAQGDREAYPLVFPVLLSLASFPTIYISNT